MFVCKMIKTELLPPTGGGGKNWKAREGKRDLILEQSRTEIKQSFFCSVISAHPPSGSLQLGTPLTEVWP